jgi:hypothetical protein
MHQERHVAGMRVLIEMVDARGVEGGRAPLDAVHGIAEAQQILGEIGAVLPGDAGKERHAPFRILNRHFHSEKTAGDCPTSSSTTPKIQNTLRWINPRLFALWDIDRVAQTPIMTLFPQANLSQETFFN